MCFVRPSLLHIPPCCPAHRPLSSSPRLPSNVPSVVSLEVNKDNNDHLAPPSPSGIYWTVGLINRFSGTMTWHRTPCRTALTPSKDWRYAMEALHPNDASHPSLPSCPKDNGATKAAVFINKLVLLVNNNSTHLAPFLSYPPHSVLSRTTFNRVKKPKT